MCTFADILVSWYRKEEPKMAVAKMDRIDLRISSEDKRTLEMAAASKRVSLSSYIVSLALQGAAADLEREKTIKVSLEGWAQLIEMLDNPPEPTESLKRLFQ